MRDRRGMLLLGALAVAQALSAAPSRAEDTVAIAVADFDYSDSSGEVADQAEAHSARVAAFATLLRDDLARRDFRVVRPACALPACTAASMAPDELIAAARSDGARYLVYGGIRKMSTLVQWGEVQMVDLQREQLLFRRTVTFRGDTDQAFSHAAAFVGETVNDAMGK